MRTANPFLSTVCSRLRAGRPLMADEPDVTLFHEQVASGVLVRCWFRSGGCTYDSRGLCAMCNYGRSRGLAADVPLKLAEAMRGSVPAGSLLLVSPSGSMLDPREVPVDIRRRILALAASTDAGTVISESRPENVTEEVAAEFKAILGAKAALEFGLESSSPWLLKWSINKGLSLGMAERAFRISQALGIETFANICLGAAFLSPAAAIADSVRSVHWALDHGADQCCVFPMHVRQHTLLAWLWERGLYAPPSLWSLVEVLRQLRQFVPNQVATSWYRDYSTVAELATDGMAIVASPTTCPRCVTQVLAVLDELRSTGRVDVLDTLVRESRCACLETWRSSLGRPAIDIEAAGRQLSVIGRGVLGDTWWDSKGAAVLDEMARDADESMTTAM